MLYGQPGDGSWARSAARRGTLFALPPSDARTKGVMILVLDPGGLLAWLLVGLIAGLLASFLVGGTGLGIIGDLIIGILGAIVGGYLAGLLGFTGVVGFWGSVLVALFGAVVLLVILHALAPRRAL